MSKDPQDPQADYDFWQCVACALCHLPFATPSGPTVPFWLTECGHVICNNHLKADQSCAQCGSQGIQLVPLQREMDAPMSEWFRPITDSLDTVTFAAKFQFEMMATQLHYHKVRHQQLRNFLDRLKKEVAELKKSNDALLMDNQRLRQQFSGFSHREATQHPASMLNSNGKRPMTEYRQSGSSPRSGMSPPGPHRLTLSTAQDALNYPSHRSAQADTANMGDNQATLYKPGSESFQSQYSYKAPATPLQNRAQASNIQGQPTTHTRNAQYPTYSKFKPTLPPIHQSQHPGLTPKHSTMGPPPTPVRLQSNQASRPKFVPPTSAGPQRFVPSANQFAQHNIEFRGSSSRSALPDNSGQQMSINASSFKKFG